MLVLDPGVIFVAHDLCKRKNPIGAKGFRIAMNSGHIQKVSKYENQTVYFLIPTILEFSEIPCELKNPMRTNGFGWESYPSLEYVADVISVGSRD